MKEVVTAFRSAVFEQTDTGAAVAVGARVGSDGFLGRGVTLHPGVQVGDQCIVLDSAIIGRWATVMP